MTKSEFTIWCNDKFPMTADAHANMVSDNNYNMLKRREGAAVTFEKFKDNAAVEAVRQMHDQIVEIRAEFAKAREVLEKCMEKCKRWELSHTHASLQDRLRYIQKATTEYLIRLDIKAEDSNG